MNRVVTINELDTDEGLVLIITNGEFYKAVLLPSELLASNRIGNYKKQAYDLLERVWERRKDEPALIR